MASCEDFFYEIYSSVREKGISEAFYNQLDKMKFQDKHRYKSVRDHWEYAYKKISNEPLQKETELKS